MFLDAEPSSVPQGLVMNIHIHSLRNYRQVPGMSQSSALLLELFGKVMLTLLTHSEGESGRRHCFLPEDVIFSFCGHNDLYLFTGFYL